MCIKALGNFVGKKNKRNLFPQAFGISGDIKLYHVLSHMSTLENSKDFPTALHF